MPMFGSAVQILSVCELTHSLLPAWATASRCFPQSWRIQWTEVESCRVLTTSRWPRGRSPCHSPKSRDKDSRFLLNGPVAAVLTPQPAPTAATYVAVCSSVRRGDISGHRHNQDFITVLVGFNRPPQGQPRSRATWHSRTSSSAFTTAARAPPRYVPW